MWLNGNSGIILLVRQYNGNSGIILLVRQYNCLFVVFIWKLRLLPCTILSSPPAALYYVLWCLNVLINCVLTCHYSLASFRARLYSTLMLTGALITEEVSPSTANAFINSLARKQCELIWWRRRPIITHCIKSSQSPSSDGCPASCLWIYPASSTSTGLVRACSDLDAFLVSQEWRLCKYGC